MDRYFTLIKMTGEGNEITNIPENNEITFFLSQIEFSSELSNYKENES